MTNRFYNIEYCVMSSLVESRQLLSLARFVELCLQLAFANFHFPLSQLQLSFSSLSFQLVPFLTALLLPLDSELFDGQTLHLKRVLLLFQGPLVSPPLLDEFVVRTSRRCLSPASSCKI